MFKAGDKRLRREGGLTNPNALKEKLQRYMCKAELSSNQNRSAALFRKLTN